MKRARRLTAWRKVTSRGHSRGRSLVMISDEQLSGKYGLAARMTHLMVLGRVCGILMSPRVSFLEWSNLSWSS